MQHPVFQVPLGALILQPPLHQRRDAAGQPVDAPADIAHLIVPLDGRVGGEIPPADALQLLLQGPHRPGNHPAQQKCQQHAQRQNDQHAEQHTGGQGGQALPQGGQGDGAGHIHPAAAHGIAQNQRVAALGLPHGGAVVQKIQGFGNLLPGEGAGGHGLQPVGGDAPGAAVHDPVQVAFPHQPGAAHGVGDEGGRYRDVGPGPAAVAAADGAGDRNALHRAREQQRIVGHHDPGIFPAACGEQRQAGDGLAVEGAGLAGDGAHLNQPVAAVGDDKPLDVPGGVHRGIFVGDCVVDAGDQIPHVIIVQNIVAHRGVDGTPVRQTVNLLHRLAQVVGGHLEGVFGALNGGAAAFPVGGHDAGGADRDGNQQGKHQRQHHIDKARKHRACRPQSHGDDAAALVVEQCCDLLHQQIGVQCVFRQNHPVFGGKLHRTGPPLAQFLGVAGQIAHKLVAGFPQARQHHKRHSKQNAQHQQRAQGQADRAGQLFGRIFANTPPCALHRVQQNVDDKGKRAAHQKWRKHRQHSAQKLQHSVQIQQHPRKHKRKQQCVKNIAGGFFFQNDPWLGFSGSFVSLCVGCLFYHGFLPLSSSFCV